MLFMLVRSSQNRLYEIRLNCLKEEEGREGQREGESKGGRVSEKEEEKKVNVCKK